MNDEFCDVCGAPEVAGGFVAGAMDVELCRECLGPVLESVRLVGPNGGLMMVRKMRQRIAIRRAVSLALSHRLKGTN